MEKLSAGTGEMVKAGETGNVVRMNGSKLNKYDPVGPGIDKGSYDPNLTYIVSLDRKGIPQSAEVVGGGYKKGGPVMDGYEEGGPVMEEEMMEETVETEPMEAESQPVESLTFDSYLEQGVNPDLVEQGNQLAMAMQDMDFSSREEVDAFGQTIQEFVAAVEAARDAAVEDGDPEVMRALKEMLSDAKDLQASLGTISSEAMAMGDIENNPEAALEV